MSPTPPYTRPRLHPEPFPYISPISPLLPSPLPREMKHINQGANAAGGSPESEVNPDLCCATPPRNATHACASSSPDSHLHPLPPPTKPQACAACIRYRNALDVADFHYDKLRLETDQQIQQIEARVHLRDQELLECRTAREDLICRIMLLERILNENSIEFPL